MEQFLRDIIEFFRDPENVKAFKEWGNNRKPVRRHDLHIRRLRPRPRQSAAPVYPAQLGTGTRALAPATDAVLAPACV